MDTASPVTVHVRLAPIVVLASGTAQVPWVTALAEPQLMEPLANRTS